MANESAFYRLADTLKSPSAGVLATQIIQSQKMGFIWKKATVNSVSSGLAVNGGSEAWANGRFPFRITIDASVGGATRRVHAFVIHAKATTSTNPLNDYQRRTTDAETFYEYLNSFYGTDNVIVLGDFNDDVIRTVVDSTKPSPYKVFVDDKARWNVLTKKLSEDGLNSYVGFSQSNLDHILVSNELSPAVYRTKLETPGAYLSSYTSTVSDHVPVTTRIFLNNITVGVDGARENQSLVRIAPNPSSGSARIELVNEREGYVRLEIVNILGTSVATLQDGVMPAEIRLFDSGPLDLQSGLYNCRLTQQGVSTQIPLVITR
jgi:hypothetical protein